MKVEMILTVKYESFHAYKESFSILNNTRKTYCIQHLVWLGK